MQKLSIGMFDSGVGGLTVLKEVKKLLPSEHIIYFGDTARVPYGNRSPQAVTKYALESALFLLTKGIKLLAIAYNTSSALALHLLQKKFPIPVIGVIDPCAKEVITSTKNKRVGVIGTKATIKSSAYEKSIQKLDPKIQVFSRSCPLFVPIAEEGLENDEVAYLMAEKYLKGLLRSDIDTLVMGCTHYLILEDVIKKVMGEQVSIVNAGRETAKEIKNILEKKKILNDKGKGGCEYFVTDSPESFEEIGRRILKEPLTKVKSLKNLDYKDYLLTS
jgi:glutamate racemase